MKKMISILTVLVLSIVTMLQIPAHLTTHSAKN